MKQSDKLDWYLDLDEMTLTQRHENDNAYIIVYLYCTTKNVLFAFNHKLTDKEKEYILTQIWDTKIGGEVASDLVGEHFSREDLIAFAKADDVNQAMTWIQVPDKYNPTKGERENVKYFS